MRNRKLPPQTRILLAGLMLISTVVLEGCSTLPQCPELPKMPTHPVLKSLKRSADGGIILNKDDSAALAVYIQSLERGYQ